MDQVSEFSTATRLTFTPPFPTLSVENVKLIVAAGRNKDRTVQIDSRDLNEDAPWGDEHQVLHHGLNPTVGYHSLEVGIFVAPISALRRRACHRDNQ
jgi:hypothetical protein